MESDFIRMIEFWRKLYSRKNRGHNMYNAENKTVMLPSGAEMYYAKFGKGTKQLVMIPDLNIVNVDGTAANLAYFYRRFAKDFTVYVFYRRKGCNPKCTIRSMSDDVADAVKSLNITNAYVLGVSQGGMIAQYLAAEHSEFVQKLVLGVTAARTNPVMLEAVREWITIAESGDLKGVLTKNYDKMYTEKQMKKYRMLIPLMMKFTKLMSIYIVKAHHKCHPKVIVKCHSDKYIVKL